MCTSSELVVSFYCDNWIVNIFSG